LGMQSSLSDDPDWRSAIDLVAALRRRETSAAETLEAVLERADRVGPVLNPFSVRLDRRAREAATLRGACDDQRLTLVSRCRDGVWLSRHGRLRASGDKRCGQAGENCAGASDEGAAHPNGHLN